MHCAAFRVQPAKHFALTPEKGARSGTVSAVISVGRPVRLCGTCEACGTENETWVQFGVGVKVMRPRVTEPCDSCQRPVPLGGADGVWETHETSDGRLVTELRSATSDELAELSELLAQIKSQPGLSPEDVFKSLEETGGSLADAVGSWIKANGGYLSALALIVAILQLIVQMAEDDTPPPVIVENVVDRVRVEVPKDRDGLPRNVPCPCDSGRKWKKCHGAPETSPKRPVK